MSASPAATPDTTPLAFTVATAVLDEVQVACAVTFCVLALENVAVAVNCAVAPGAGAEPVTATDVTVDGVDVPGLELLLLLHAADAAARINKVTSTRMSHPSCGPTDRQLVLCA